MNTKSEKPQGDRPFSWEQRAAFDQSDPAGILFYGNYPRLAHRAIEEFIVHMGFNWEQWFANPLLGVPIRRLEVDYLSPLWAGKIYHWQVSLEKLGDSSLEFNVSVVEKSTFSLCARIRSVHVFIDLKDKKKLPIPPEFRQRLQQYL